MVRMPKRVNIQHAIFAYGTLQIPEVMTAVTGRIFPSQPAELRSYGRFSLRGLAYPGIRWQPGAVTGGRLYRDIDAVSLQRLDQFQDAFYRRQSLIIVDSSGEAVAAEVYVISKEYYGMLSEEAWDIEQFRTRSLSGFLQNCKPPE